jgi:hypothetical protein
VCAAGGNVVDVEDQVGEAFVEDAGLDGKGDLGSEEGGFGGAAGAEGEGSEPEGHKKGESGADKGENADGNENAFAADAQRSEGDDLAVHGHAAEAEENTDEHAHGDGEDENAGDNTEEEDDDLRGRTGMTDENLHETDELGDEEDKREDEETEQGVTGDFAGNVTIEDAHEAKGECNMGVGLGTGVGG